MSFQTWPVSYYKSAWSVWNDIGLTLVSVNIERTQKVIENKTHGNVQEVYRD